MCEYTDHFPGIRRAIDRALKTNEERAEATTLSWLIFEKIRPTWNGAESAASWATLRAIYRVKMDGISHHGRQGYQDALDHIDSEGPNTPRHAKNNNPAGAMIRAELLDSFTPEDRQLATMLGDGYTLAEIGDQTGRTYHSVYHHRRRIRKNLENSRQRGAE